MTPLEAAARAICYANCITSHPGDVERATTQTDAGWDMWVPEAKAALEALREPSEGMVEVGDAISVRDFVPAGQFTTLTWQAMLTAALGEQP